LNFLEITRQFEDKIKADFEVELLELHYIPYAFGSGTKSYRINGRNIKIVFDGCDGIIEIYISGQHEKYDKSSWTNIFRGTSAAFKDKAIKEVDRRIKA
jgi:hypothetical protein